MLELGKLEHTQVLERKLELVHKQVLELEHKQVPVEGKLVLELGNKLEQVLEHKLVLELGSMLVLELEHMLVQELGSTLVLELGSKTLQAWQHNEHEAWTEVRS